MVEGGPPEGPTAPPRLATEVIGRRAIQFIIDTALYAVLVNLSVKLLATVPGADAVLLVPVAGWGLVIFVLVPWRFRGRTPGMAIMSIRVVRRGGGPATFGQLLVRWLVLIVEGWFLVGLLGLLLLSMSRHHTRLGDKVAGTWVVWAPRGEPAWI